MRTLEEAKAAMANNSLPAGEQRRYQKCRACSEIWVREFIPFGIGMGRSFGACLCVLTGNDKKGHDVLESTAGLLERDVVSDKEN